jgi:transposase InsO family protein
MMAWKVNTKMSQRYEFLQLANKEDCNFSQLCKRFNISRPTGYKWLSRYDEKDLSSLEDQSKKPHHSKYKTDVHIESLILDLRKQHISWGGRKLKRRLEDLGHENIPSATTIGNILKRNGIISAEASEKATSFIRFEHPNPNDLWQMDFKGWFNMDKARCYPLTVLDDHSRYSIVLKACLHERTGVVQEALIEAFRKYGLPKRMTMDNGSPWAGHARKQLTTLVAWLIRLGIKVSHSRPYHPQTQGKDERFHRTMKVELLNHNYYSDLEEVAGAFIKWQHIYNTQRPHEALGMDTPISHYKVSPRNYPEVLPVIEYDSNDTVRKITNDGKLSVHGIVFTISRALVGQYIALRPTKIDGIIDVFYCHQKIKTLDLRAK